MKFGLEFSDRPEHGWTPLTPTSIVSDFSDIAKRLAQLERATKTVPEDFIRPFKDPLSIRCSACNSDNATHAKQCSACGATL
jgi:hypothetical protein